MNLEVAICDLKLGKSSCALNARRCSRCAALVRVAHFGAQLSGVRRDSQRQGIAPAGQKVEWYSRNRLVV